MKTIIILLIGITLYSCGSDNPVTNSPAPNTSDTVLLFTKDSIYLNDASVSFKDSVEFFCTAQVDTLFVEYSIFAYRVECQVNLSFGSYIKNHLVNTISTLSDSSYILPIPVNSANFNNKFLLNRISSQPNHLLSIRNIRLWYCR